MLIFNYFLLKLQFPEFFLGSIDYVYTAAAAAAESLQSCPTLCDPIDGSQPGSPISRILRQEHCSGLPFPSPMHEGEKWKSSRSVVSDSPRPHRLQPTRLLRQWDFPGKSTGVGCHCLLRYIYYIYSVYMCVCVCVCAHLSFRYIDILKLSQCEFYLKRKLFF